MDKLINLLASKTSDILPNNNQKSVRADYIYPISYKNAKKGKSYEMDLPLLENDITTFELALKYGIHSRCQQLRPFAISWSYHRF
jgi:hypothetical protein